MACSSSTFLELAGGDAAAAGSRLFEAATHGIIFFITTGAWDDATGHFDLWDGEMMVENTHHNAETTTRYFGLAVSITFWEMQ
jgi:hypothetical protein